MRKRPPTGEQVGYGSLGYYMFDPLFPMSKDVIKGFVLVASFFHRVGKKRVNGHSIRPFQVEFVDHPLDGMLNESLFQFAVTHRVVTPSFTHSIILSKERFLGQK